MWACGRGRAGEAYRRVLGQLDLLRQSHEQHVGPLRHPLFVERRLGGRTLDIVGRLQAPEQASQRRVHIGGQDGHGGGGDGCTGKRVYRIAGVSYGRGIV